MAAVIDGQVARRKIIFPLLPEPFQTGEVQDELSDLDWKLEIAGGDNFDRDSITGLTNGESNINIYGEGIELNNQELLVDKFQSQSTIQGREQLTEESLMPVAKAAIAHWQNLGVL